MMKTALLIAIPGGMFATGVMWWLGEHLSSDAIAMAIGLFFGALSLVPATVLVLAGGRRDDEDDWQDDHQTIDAYPTTPYYKLAQRVIGEPRQLSSRQAEIDTLRSALAYLEDQEVHHATTH